ncbi:MAG: hypothetical protein R2939_10445 [Kofleriaceae bacterium]
MSSLLRRVAPTSLPGCALAWLTLTACGGAATPAARWDATERARIDAELSGCDFFEEEAQHAAGYACDLGTLRAYDLSAPEDHAAVARRLAEAKAQEPVTAPLHEFAAREPIVFGDATFASSIATYLPEEGTIIPPEVFLIASPEHAGRQAYSCAVTLLAGLDTGEALAARISACVDGLRLLYEASR